MSENNEKNSAIEIHINLRRPAYLAKVSTRKWSGILVGIAAVIILLIVGLVSAVDYWQDTRDRKPPVGLPAGIITQIASFKPYYFRRGYSINFVLQKSTISYQDGVLLFTMNGPAKKSLVFTEEAEPPNIIRSIQGDEEFDTEYGKAFVSYKNLNRTTGSLFTYNNTWIIVNAPNPIGAALMQQVLDNLTPVAKA